MSSKNNNNIKNDSCTDKLIILDSYANLRNYIEDPINSPLLRHHALSILDELETIFRLTSRPTVLEQKKKKEKEEKPPPNWECVHLNDITVNDDASDVKKCAEELNFYIGNQELLMNDKKSRRKKNYGRRNDLLTTDIHKCTVMKDHCVKKLLVILKKKEIRDRSQTNSSTHVKKDLTLQKPESHFRMTQLKQSSTMQMKTRSVASLSSARQKSENHKDESFVKVSQAKNADSNVIISKSYSTAGNKEKQKTKSVEQDSYPLTEDTSSKLIYVTKEKNQIELHDKSASDNSETTSSISIEQIEEHQIKISTSMSEIEKNSLKYHKTDSVEQIPPSDSNAAHISVITNYSYNNKEYGKNVMGMVKNKLFGRRNSRKSQADQLQRAKDNEYQFNMDRKLDLKLNRRKGSFDFKKYLRNRSESIMRRDKYREKNMNKYESASKFQFQTTSDTNHLAKEIPFTNINVNMGKSKHSGKNTDKSKKKSEKSAKKKSEKSSKKGGKKKGGKKDGKHKKDKSTDGSIVAIEEKVDEILKQETKKMKADKKSKHSKGSSKGSKGGKSLTEDKKSAASGKSKKSKHKGKKGKKDSIKVLESANSDTSNLTVDDLAIEDFKKNTKVDSVSSVSVGKKSKKGKDKKSKSSKGTKDKGDKKKGKGGKSKSKSTKGTKHSGKKGEAKKEIDPFMDSSLEANTASHDAAASEALAEEVPELPPKPTTLEKKDSSANPRTQKPEPTKTVESPVMNPQPTKTVVTESATPKIGSIENDSVQPGKDSQPKPISGTNQLYVEDGDVSKTFSCSTVGHYCFPVRL
ncbi:hypothetical protein SNEBB_010372 [Seison nebaliae]|nr:hypothetical protein SNEBB_010372 [Seison nebaliae]